MSFLKNHLSRPISLLLGLVIGFSVSSAQETEEDDREVRGRKAWIVATAIPDDLENPAKFMSGKDVVEVALSKRSVGKPVKISKDGVIRMVREIPDPEDPENVIYKTLARAVVPDGISNALIILIPLKENAEGLLYSAQVQNLAKFTGGDTLYMNFSPRNVMVRLGEDKIGLRSGESSIHDAGSLGKSVNRPVSYHHYDPEKKKWKLLSASTVVLRPTRREICIFSWDPRFERIDYHGITFPVSN